MLTIATAIATLAAAVFADIQRAKLPRHIQGFVESYDPATGRMVLRVYARGSGMQPSMEYREEIRYVPVLLPPGQTLPPIDFTAAPFPMAVIGIQGDDGVIYATGAYPGGGAEPQMPGLLKREVYPEVDPTMERQRRAAELPVDEIAALTARGDRLGALRLLADHLRVPEFSAAAQQISEQDRDQILGLYLHMLVYVRELYGDEAHQRLYVAF